MSTPARRAILRDRLGVAPGSGARTTLLIIGGAGGVGSILIQVARQLTALTVIATASRPESADWCRSLGAHHVVDHVGDLATQVAALGAPAVTYVAALTQTDQHFPMIAQIVAPQGRVALIDDPGVIDVRLLKQNSVSLHRELMFTRSMFQTPDMIRQHGLLNEVAALLDDGRLRTTLREQFGAISAENLLQAHRLLESGASRGKIVLAGFHDRTA